MAYSDSTTIGEIIRLSSDVLANNDVLEVGKRKLAKIFLEKLLDHDETATYEMLESAYRACSPREQIPESSEEFWIFVEKEYLRLESEPKQKFTELAFRVTEDLGKVAANLDYISKELESLEEKKKEEGRLSADDRYYRNQLEYFKEKNLIAKDEIVDFMTYRAKSYAIKEASVPPIGIAGLMAKIGKSFFGKTSPYAFGRRISGVLPDPYDVKGLDTYANKFMDLPVSSYQEVVEELRGSPEKFKEFAVSYIAGNEDIPSVRSKLRDLVQKSHILASRKKVIEAMLKHFEEKDFISFVSMAPLQIEGVFADICREIGISESQLDISSLNDKLQHIDGKMRSFFFFEYYSFKFPVLRNLVAHGGLVDGEMEDTAIHLLLDLLPVCELTEAEELPINHALKVLKKASEGDHSSLVEWLDLREKVKIPDFYDVKQAVVNAEACYSSQEFWNYLECELKKVKDTSEVKKSLPVKVAGILKNKKIAEEKAVTFLKSSAQVVAEAIERRNASLEKFKKTLPSE